MIPLRRRKFISWILILGGLADVIGGAVLGGEELMFESGAAHTTGTIVELRTTHSPEGDSMAPVFRFADAAGKEHTISSWISYRDLAMKVGESVPIIYRPEAPDRARIEPLVTSRTVPLLIIGAGTATMLVGLILLRRWVRAAQVRARPA